MPQANFFQWFFITADFWSLDDRLFIGCIFCFELIKHQLKTVNIFQMFNLFLKFHRRWLPLLHRCLLLCLLLCCPTVTSRCFCLEDVIFGHQERWRQQWRRSNCQQKVIVFWHTWHFTNTRKPSCRWQTRATLAKSLHGLRKSSGVVSCIVCL